MHGAGLWRRPEAALTRVGRDSAQAFLTPVLQFEVEETFCNHKELRSCFLLFVNRLLISVKATDKRGQGSSLCLPPPKHRGCSTVLLETKFLISKCV